MCSWHLRRVRHTLHTLRDKRRLKERLQMLLSRMPQPYPQILLASVGYRRSPPCIDAAPIAPLWKIDQALVRPLLPHPLQLRLKTLPMSA